MKASEAFSIVYNGGKNIMTPNAIRYGNCGPYYYEISEGRGMSYEPIFGVTFITMSLERAKDINRLCRSLEEANEYVKEVRSWEDDEESQE